MASAIREHRAWQLLPEDVRRGDTADACRAAGLSETQAEVIAEALEEVSIEENWTDHQRDRGLALLIKIIARRNR